MLHYSRVSQKMTKNAALPSSGCIINRYTFKRFPEVITAKFNAKFYEQASKLLKLTSGLSLTNVPWSSKACVKRKQPQLLSSLHRFLISQRVLEWPVGGTGLETPTPTTMKTGREQLIGKVINNPFWEKSRNQMLKCFRLYVTGEEKLAKVLEHQH